MNEAYEVPLYERLETVPQDARLIVVAENGLNTTFIPIGREAKLAAAELRRLHTLNQELVEALNQIIALDRTEENEWDAVERVIPTMIKIAKTALAKARRTE